MNDSNLQIDFLEKEAKKYYNFEQSIKLVLNSIYGAFGNQYFTFFNVDIAETITMQGQDAILYTEKLINKYFLEFWHKDFDIHKKLGITVLDQIKNPVSIYIDTDSVFIKFDEVLKKCKGWNKSETEFILEFYEYRFKDFLEKILQKYANDNNTENYLSFELETISKNAIWLAKKKYIQNIVWKEPHIYYDDLTNIKAKGFEIVQSSTPIFAREKLTELIKYIFSLEKMDVKEFAKKLKQIKREFKLTNIDNICFSKKINNYQKYIINDIDQFEFASACPIGVRGAGYYNYLLNNSKFKGKYQLLSNGEKLKMYHSSDNFCNVFAYLPNEYPYEFAPPIDYDTQFEKTILDPINRVIVAMGFKGFNRNIIYTEGIF